MNAPRIMASCCSADQVDSALMEPCRDCPARATPLRTSRLPSDVPRISLDAGEEPMLFAESCMGRLCSYVVAVLLCGAAFALGCWALKVPAWFWR